MLRTAKVVSVSFFVLLISAFVFAQGGVATGDLHVTVKDPKGASVANATVTAQDVAKGLERTANSDGQGGYSVQLLPPGTYTVTIVTPGFTKIQSTGVAITVGGLVELPVTLSISSRHRSRRSYFAGRTGRNLAQFDDRHDRPAPHRQSADQRTQLHQLHAHRFAGGSRQCAQHRRRAHVRPQHERTARAFEPGQRRWRRRHRQLGQRRALHRLAGSGAGISDHYQQLRSRNMDALPAAWSTSSPAPDRIDFHGDVFGYLRNRNFQAVNPFSTVPDPAYTRVQAGVGLRRSDQERQDVLLLLLRNHAPARDRILQHRPGQFWTYSVRRIAILRSASGLANLQLTPEQVGFLANPAVDAIDRRESSLRRRSRPIPRAGRRVVRHGGEWDLAHAALSQASTLARSTSWTGFPTSCPPPGPCLAGVPASYQTLASQEGNFPVFEGTSLYSLRLDHNLSANQSPDRSAPTSAPAPLPASKSADRISPSGRTPTRVLRSRPIATSPESVQDTWTIGNNKVNEFRFQYARRGLSYFYNTQIPGGSDPAVNISGLRLLRTRAVLLHSARRAALPVHRQFFLDHRPSQHQVRRRFQLPADHCNFHRELRRRLRFRNFQRRRTLGSSFPVPTGFPNFPDLSAVQAYGAGLPGDFIQGIGSPSDSFHNIPIGAFLAGFLAR